MKRLLILISIIIALLLFACKKEEETIFDFSQVPGEYEIVVSESSNSPISISDGTVSIIQTDLSTFYFSFDHLSNDTIPDIKFNIVEPFSVFPTNPDYYKARIALIENSMFQIVPVDEINNYILYFEYPSQTNGITAQFTMIFTSHHSYYDTLQYSILFKGEIEDLLNS